MLLFLGLLVVFFGRGRRCNPVSVVLSSVFYMEKRRNQGETYLPPLQYSHHHKNAPSAHKATYPQVESRGKLTITEQCSAHPHAENQKLKVSLEEERKRTS